MTCELREEYESLLKEKEQTLIIDIREALPYLTIFPKDNVFHNDYPEGLYVPGEITPRIYANNRKYYYRDDYVQLGLRREPIDITTLDFRTMRSDIVNDSGEVVIKRLYANAPGFKLTNKPTVSIARARFVIGMIIQYFDNLNPHHRQYYGLYNPRDQLRKKYKHYLDNEIADEAFSLYLTTRLGPFVNGDNYAMYSYRLDGFSLTIKKSIDIRIYQWYQDRMELPF